MAEIILSIVISCAAIGFYLRSIHLHLEARMESSRQENFATRRAVEDVLAVVQSVESMLKEASRIKAVRESVFEGDKIPDRPGKMSYIPVARRRAAAEFASLSPKTHEDKVRENNARAIESAG